eukprot:4688921-Karenia_brevis.AAC.1
MGLPTNVLNAIRAMYSGLERRFQCGTGVGRPFNSTNGILQGCPLSVLFVNALMSVWAAAIEEEVPDAEPACFADDSSLTCRTRRSVQIGADVTADFVKATGQDVNVGRSCAYTTVAGGPKR